MSETTVAKRGFHRKDDAAQELLETVGRVFLTAYEQALEAGDDAGAVADQLDAVPAQFRGFAYEGATMGYAVRDGLPLGRSDRAAHFLAGRGAAHVYTGYVGVGWAMARLPRFRWPSSSGMDPLLRWLALDGWGFHQAYFHTDRYVGAQFRPASLGWLPEHAGYQARAIDQGIGRALWFVGGAEARVVADLVDDFDETRRGDLYSGVGLAATYAAGASEDELHTLWERAGVHRGSLAQGSAFAAEARLRGGIVLESTELATRVLTGFSVHEAAQITQDTKDGLSDGELPAYELWRQRIASALLGVAGGKS